MFAPTPTNIVIHLLNGLRLRFDPIIGFRLVVSAAPGATTVGQGPPRSGSGKRDRRTNDSREAGRFSRGASRPTRSLWRSCSGNTSFPRLPTAYPASRTSGIRYSRLSNLGAPVRYAYWTCFSFVYFSGEPDYCLRFSDRIRGLVRITKRFSVTSSSTRCILKWSWWFPGSDGSTRAP